MRGDNPVARPIKRNKKREDTNFKFQEGSIINITQNFRPSQQTFFCYKWPVCKYLKLHTLSMSQILCLDLVFGLFINNPLTVD